MILHGHIQNGAIVLDDPPPLPEGAAVEVQVFAAPPPQPGENSPPADVPTVAERLKDFIGILEDLPEDAARNHDHYLYGAPKKP